MGNSIAYESETWLNRFPNEILHLIFGYLSQYDLFHTFLFFNQRFQNILIETNRYVGHIELLDTNLNEWKRIFSIINEKIECLTINTIDLSFSLENFPNLRRLILSLPYSISDEEFKVILHTNHFSNLRLFQIKENKFFSDHLKYQRFHMNQSILFTHIFSIENSLETFDCSLTYSPLQINNMQQFQINSKLHSLTLHLIYFEQIFVLLQYTPNLIYLNIQSHVFGHIRMGTEKFSVKLNELHLKCSMMSERYIFCDGNQNTVKNFPLLMQFIQQFYSTLKILSLNFSRLNIHPPDDFVCHSERLQDFLESMIELKQFSYYGRVFGGLTNNQSILSQYQSSYWLNHPQWNSFGMYRNYFCTLPFAFDHLDEFTEGFRHVKSNNPQILTTDHTRLWSNVRSIELSSTVPYSRTFVKQLKIQMPKLTKIQFSDLNSWERDNTMELNLFDEKRTDTNCLLSHVTTVQIAAGSIDSKKEWFLYYLPNVKHVSLSSNQVIHLFNRNIQRLDIDGVEDFKWIDLSNIQYVNLCINNYASNLQMCVNRITQIMINLKDLKILFIYLRPISTDFMYMHGIDFHGIIALLNQTKTMKDYKIKLSPTSCLFVKQMIMSKDQSSIWSRLAYFI